MDDITRLAYTLIVIIVMYGFASVSERDRKEKHAQQMELLQQIEQKIDSLKNNTSPTIH